MNITTRKLVNIAMLSALSVILIFLLRFPLVAAAPFLEYDPGDIPMLIGSFSFGPLAGMFIVVVASIIQGLTVSAGSGWIGIVMHIIASGTFVLTAGLIYKKIHTKKGALISLICGSLAMALIMIPTNLFFTVKFWGMPLETVKALILPGIIPFNLIKAGINSVAVFLLYKPLQHLMGQKKETTSKKKSIA